MILAVPCDNSRVFLAFPNFLPAELLPNKYKHNYANEVTIHLYGVLHKGTTQMRLQYICVPKLKCHAKVLQSFSTQP